MRLTTAFKPDYERYEGVRPINIYALRLGYVLVFLFAGVRCVVLFIVGFAVMIGALGLYVEPIWIYMACY